MKQKKAKIDIGKSIQSMLKKLTWQDYLLIVVLIVFIAIKFNVYTTYQHLPSPIYGGDNYRDRGFIQNIISGNPIWSDQYFAGELNYYGWGGTAIYAGLVKVLNSDIESFMLYFGLVLQLILTLSYYALGKELLKRKELALVIAVFAHVNAWEILAKPSSLTFALGIPLFFLFWLKYERENKLKHGIIMGIILGLCALVYGGHFVLLVGMFAIGVILKFILEALRLNKKELPSLVINYVKKYWYVATIAVTISLIYFLPLIIQYKFHIYNYVTKYGDASTANTGPLWALNTIFKMFFNTSSVHGFILGMLGLLGLIHCVLNRKKVENKWVLVWAVSSILLVEHHVITRPLFDYWFNPSHLYFFYFPFLLLQGFGFKEVLLQLKKRIGDAKLPIVFITIFMILLIPMAYQVHTSYLDSQWTKYGQTMEPTTASVYEAGDWMLQNMNKDETILANDETSFALAAVSGRKVMISRRTHASYFVDVDKRIAEAAVVMYGNDAEETKRILKEYNVKYFFEDAQLYRNALRTRMNMQEYLDEHNIQYVIQNNPWDHANTQSEPFDFIYIPHQNLSVTFKGMLEEVKNIGTKDMLLGKIYRINTD